MRELDQVEQRLKKQQAEIAQGLELIQATKKVINAIGTTAKVTSITATATPAKTNGAKKPTTTVSTMSAAAKKKQKAKSREYWAKVKSGEIVRKGYVVKAHD